MTDTRERFLREITERIPAEQIAELHLFRPMRRGATETGVAVIAAIPAVEANDAGADTETPDPVPDSGSVERTSTSASTPEERTTPVVETVARIPVVVDETAETVLSPSDNDGSPYAEDYAAAFGLIDSLGPETSSPSPTAGQRHTVFTARYRLTLKGPDRGKWEFDVVADADAPLVAVDTVVRGVQRRAGDEEDPERLTAEGLRAALDGQSWRTTT